MWLFPSAIISTAVLKQIATELGHRWVIIPQRHHDDVIKWKHFMRYWPFVRGIHRSPVNSPQKGQWRGALMFSLICVWINDWVNNREAGDLRRYRAHYGVIVMWWYHSTYPCLNLTVLTKEAIVPSPVPRSVNRLTNIHFSELNFSQMLQEMWR